MYATHKIRFKSQFTTALFLLLSAVVLTLMVVVLTPDFAENIWDQNIAHPVIALLEFGFVAASLFFFYCVFGRVVAAEALVSLALFLFCVINRYKVFFRGDPFVPADVLLGGEVLSIAAASSMQLGRGILLLLCAIVATLVTLLLFVRFPVPRLRYRLLVAALVAALFGVAYAKVYTDDGIYGSIPIRGNGYNVVNEFNSRGFVVSFLYHTKDLVPQKPEGYSKEAAERVLAGYGGDAVGGGDTGGGAAIDGIAASADSVDDENTGGNSGEGGDVAAFRPDVVVLMSEAFWDVTQLPGLDFSQADPIPHYHALEQAGVTGDLYVDVSGGGTDMTEFSFLTGDAQANFGAEIASAYKMLIRRNTDSITRAFKSQGYDTLALHPGYKWFYNRENVYQWLGFDRFVHLGSFNEERDISGNYVSDKAMADMLFALYEEHVNGEGGGAPLFNFTVTIQNHGPYDRGWMYGGNLENYALADGYSLTQEEEYMVVNYIRGVNDADEALGRIIEYFTESRRPVVIVWFGDHLPLLGGGYSLYNALGLPMKPGEGVDLTAVAYRQRYVVWANPAAEAQWPAYAQMKNAHARMSVNYLGVSLLDMLGFPLDAYDRLVMAAKAEAPVLASRFYAATADPADPLLEDPPPAAADVLRDYRIAQYYKLFDERLEN